MARECEGLSSGHALGVTCRVAHADHHNSLVAGLVEDQIGKRRHNNPSQPWNVGALSGVGMTCDEVDRRLDPLLHPFSALRRLFPYLSKDPIKLDQGLWREQQFQRPCFRQTSATAASPANSPRAA